MSEWEQEWRGVGKDEEKNGEIRRTGGKELNKYESKNDMERTEISKKCKNKSIGRQL